LKKLFTIFRYFFLVIFLGFSVSITFFNHAHTFCGNIIIHSHPYSNDGSENQSHHHSWDEYLKIYLLSHYSDDTILAPTGLTAILTETGATLVLSGFNILPLEFINVFHLRGPPSLIYSPDIS